MNLSPHEIKCTVSDDLTFLSGSFGHCHGEKRFIVIADISSYSTCDCDPNLRPCQIFSYMHNVCVRGG